MKKFMMIFALMLFPLALVFGQVTPPDSWTDVFSDPAKWFASIGAVAALTTFLTAVVNGLLKISKEFVKQLMAWIVAVILFILGNVLGIGYMADMPLLVTVLHGIGAGFVANGIFDIPVVMAVLSFIENKLKGDK